jgi:hypothetical protein
MMSRQKRQEQKIELIKDLSENFRFRYAFYWSSYFKLALYNLLIIFSPYIILFFWINTKNDFDAQEYLTTENLKDILTAIPYITGSISGYFLYYTYRILQQEDARILNVHHAYKKLYRSFGVQLEEKIVPQKNNDNTRPENKNNMQILQSNGNIAQAAYLRFFILLNIIAFVLTMSLTLTLQAEFIEGICESLKIAISTIYNLLILLVEILKTELLEIPLND